MKEKDYRNIGKWELVNPEALVQIRAKEVNRHPQDLTGKTIVLYWNGKPNGDIFLNRVYDLLIQKDTTVRVIKAWEDIPLSKHTDPTPEASRAVANDIAGLNPDIVIGAPGDCAGSMNWLVKDQMNLEKLGIPTVTVITSPFIEMAGTIPLAEGFFDACFVEIPPPIGMLPPSQVRDKADLVFDEIMEALITWRPSCGKEPSDAAYPAGTFELTGSIEDVNYHFFQEKYSLGLPIIPPTSMSVKKMLKGTSRKPDDVLGQVPPAMGTLTVELAAVYAVMAGCRPEYMPVLLAAIEAFLSPEANFRLGLSGTGTSQLVMIINGPVMDKIGVGYGQGAAGKGHHANGSIGYAINLIGYSAGGSRPPDMDRSTLASPADYVCWVFGENEDALPEKWKPMHVEAGFKASDSVVTVMVSYPPIENMDHWSSSGEEHIRWWSQIVSPLHNMGGAAVPHIMEQNPILAIGPEHARLIASENWNKDDFRRKFWKNTRIPLSIWPSSCGREKITEMLGPLNDDSLIPVTVNSDQLLIVIAGGDGKQSHYFSPLPGSFPVSKLVRK